ncbi:MAG: WYL domain-containing protein [Phycisphaera sp.]|nr:WYL domain-containing protein [Phycisphaera sp.]
MPADYKRIHRLLHILTLIQGQQGYTAQRLADECGVTVRTLYRDMKILESVGIPYFHDPETNGYRIHKHFFMPPVELTMDEALALVALAEHIGGKEQVPLTRAAGRAIAKVRGQLPQVIQNELSEIDKHIAIELGKAGPHDGIRDVYDTVRLAIARKRVLECRYESVETSLGNPKSDGKGNEMFEFRPYALLFSQRAWYAVGYHCGRKAVRNLKLNRFTHIKQTPKPYMIPDDFKVEDHLGDAWRMIRGPRKYEVEIVFDREFAETIADTHWHRTQQAEFHEDGSITMRFKVDGLDEIVWWVLSMGPHCEVKKPPELVERVKELAQATVTRYGTVGGTGRDSGVKSTRKKTRQLTH